MSVVNPHALADWGIFTGRLPIDGRARFLSRFADDPQRATAALLRRAPTRYADRPCPLFAEPARPVRAPESPRPIARRSTTTRAAYDALNATRAALVVVGIDPQWPEVAATVSAALAEAFAEQKRAQQEAAARRARMAREKRERKERRLQEQAAGAVAATLSELAESWSDDASQAHGHTPLRASS